MKTNFRLLAVASVSLSLVFTACTKPVTEMQDNKPEQTTHNDDANTVSNEMDAVTNDANIAIESNSYFGGKVQGTLGTICDATVTVDTLSDPRTVTITYDGTNCNGPRTRTGKVILSMPANTRWKDQGAVLTVTYENLRITRVTDNKSIMINGSHTITNVTGGRLIELPTRTNIVHAINSNGMSIAFSDSTVRTWKVARQRTYTYNNGVVVSIAGTHNNGTHSGIAEWGVDRFGHLFATATINPLVFRQDCNFRLTSGKMIHYRHKGDATVTFGLDQQGNATGCPGTGSYYMRLTWTGVNGNTQSVLHPY
jgi:hypothetical protein